MSEDLSKSVELDPRFDTRTNRDPVFRYVIFSQQRSGSSWLTRRLINLAVFGVPGEYLNPRIFFELGRRLDCPVQTVDDNRKRMKLSTYMRAVERVRTSSNGWFGIKIQPNQLMPMFKGDLASAVTFLQGYDALIMLTCRDKLRQAISTAIARVTDRWSSDGREPDLAAVSMEQLLYQTAARLADHIAEDGRMTSIGRAVGRPVLALTYEQMVADPDGTLDAIARFLGHKEGLSDLSTASLVDVPRPRPGHVSAEVRRRFLDYIEGRGLI